MINRESAKSADIRKRYDAFLKKNSIFDALSAADYNSIYEDVYGTPELQRWFEERYSDCQERYDRENG